MSDLQHCTRCGALIEASAAADNFDAGDPLWHCCDSCSSPKPVTRFDVDKPVTSSQHPTHARTHSNHLGEDLADL